MLGIDFTPYSRFTGTAGQAIVSKTAAYLITDSRHWVQAANQIHSNWHLIQAGRAEAPKDWVEWLVDNVKDSHIGIDARTLCCAKAIELNNRLLPKGSKLVYPSHNLIDLIWKDRPPRPREPIYIHAMQFSGKSSLDKLAEIRSWIRKTPPITSSSSKSVPTVDGYHVATLITALDSICR